MGKTSTVHTLARSNTIRRIIGDTSVQVRLREEKDLTFAVSRTPEGGNRLSRRRKLAGKNPYHQKGGDDWRKKAQQWGQRWPSARALGVVDPTAVMPAGGCGNRLRPRMIPKPVTKLAIEKAEKRNRARKPPQHTQTAEA